MSRICAALLSRLEAIRSSVIPTPPERLRFTPGACFRRCSPAPCLEQGLLAPAGRIQRRRAVCAVSPIWGGSNQTTGAIRRGRIPRVPAYERLQAAPLLGPGVGAAPVEPLVAREEIRPVGAQPVEEDVAHLAAQMEGDAADADGPRLGRELEDP